MKVFEVLERDPRTSALANDGQARITADQDARAMRELRAELEAFVCDGQYGDALELILQSYLARLDQPRQNAAWVSGFFGSGKSHLLKMLSHLWVNTVFSDGATARTLVRRLPEEVKASLRELDTWATRTGKPPLAAAGTLLSGSGDQVRLNILSILLQACGLPEQYPQARFCLWLRDQGYLDRVRHSVEKEGKNWRNELNNLYVSGPIARAVLECDPNFAADEQEARRVIRTQFPRRTGDISTTEFIELARKALAPDGELPLTVLVLDEVQQYIGESADRAGTIGEVVEALYTQMDSRVAVVASGQSALTGTPLLQKLRDRFRITVQLSDADVEVVTRQVLLQKKPSGVEPVRQVLERSAGEISKHLQGTRLAERAEDRQTVVDDYPLLPTRRRFWEECFRAVDAAGTHSQLRSQLRILDDALKQLADREVGAVIPGDVLYEALAPDLVNTGVLLNELATKIRKLDDGSEEGRLRRRLCGLIFLIGKLPREAGVDVGVRATATTVADLLVEELGADSAALRQAVERTLEALRAEGTLMRVHEEYRLQTAEGTEWELAFREKAAALRQREADISFNRDQLLAAGVQTVMRDIRLVQGQAKLPRTFKVHVQPEPPSKEAEQVVVWVRDGWSMSQRDVEDEARHRGQEDPVIHVFLPREFHDELQARIIEAEAARQVLDAKGLPASDAGKEARESMLTRRRVAEAARDELVLKVLSSARVFQGGGNEVPGDSLAAKIERAAQASLARLFPRFSEGDHGRWDAALQRARQGSDHPFQVVGWDKPTEEHPVAKEILQVVGPGAKGGDVRRALKASPFGWPQDAIDAGLIALHRAGLLRASWNGHPIAPDQLDQTRIPVTEFRPERRPLGATEKITLRGLYQKAGIQPAPGREEEDANAFLDRLVELARAAGGDPPLPARPDTTWIEDLKRLAGTEQLGAILDRRADIERSLAEWSALHEKAERRMPDWELLQRLLAHAETLPIAVAVQSEVEALCATRSLLDEADRVSPLRVRVAAALRTVVTEQFEALQRAIAEGMQELETNASWRGLDEGTKRVVLNQVGLGALARPAMESDEALLQELDRQSLASRANAVAAVRERVAQALTLAARKLKPQAKRVEVRQAVLETEEDVRAWLTEHEQKLLEVVRQGPVIVG